MASHGQNSSPSNASALNLHGDSFHIANLKEKIQILKQVCNCFATCSCRFLVKFQKEPEDDRVINFLRDLNEEFAQVRSIMMLVSLPLIAKSFALIPYQEFREDERKLYTEFFINQLNSEVLIA